MTQRSGARDDEVERNLAEAEKLRAEAAQLTAGAQKQEAEARKAEAEAAVAELELKRQERKERAELAKDTYHHVYVFGEPVGATSVRKCIDHPAPVGRHAGPRP